MARHFSFKTFIRSVSIDLLQQYFANRQLFTDFDWTQDNGLLADTLHAQIERLPDHHAGLVKTLLADTEEAA